MSGLGRELPSEPGTNFMICITRRCADSGLSHGELLRKEDYLKSGDRGIAF